MLLIHDDCLFLILSFIPSIDLFKNCIFVSKQFHENARRVSFSLDFSLNLASEGDGCSLKTLNRENIDVLNCQYFERLEGLNLSFNNIGSFGAKLIAESTYLKNLKELILNGCTIMGEGLGYLLSNVELVSKLSGLGLARCRLTDEDMIMLAKNKSNLGNLKYLQLQNNGLMKGFGFGELICNLPCNLKELNMAHNRLDSDYHLQADFIPELELESLDLSSTSISMKNFEILNSKLKKLRKLIMRSFFVARNFKGIVLDKFPQLTYLDISSLVPAKDLLPDLHTCDNLKTLIMNRCRLLKFDQLMDLSYLVGLENLSLMDNSFSDSTVLAIAGVAAERGIDLKINTTIHSGYLKNYKKLFTDLANLSVSQIAVDLEIDEEDIKDNFTKFELELRAPFVKMGDYLRNVTVINIDCEIGDEGFRNIFTNYRLSNLRKLILSHNRIKEIPPPEVCHDNLRKLTVLDLKYNLFGDNGVQQIANNPYLSNLRILKLEINGITKEGIKHLVSSPFMHNINTLNLDDSCGGSDNKDHGTQSNIIGDEGFEMLLNSNLNNLTYLDVSRNGLGNESAKVLANHKGVKNLVDLIIFNNSFDDEAIPYLTSPTICKFQTLKILYNDISDEGIAKIEDSLAFSGLCFSIANGC